MEGGKLCYRLNTWHLCMRKSYRSSVVVVVVLVLLRQADSRSKHGSCQQERIATPRFFTVENLISSFRRPLLPPQYLR